VAEKTALERATSAIEALEADLGLTVAPAQEEARRRSLAFSLLAGIVTTVVLVVLPFVVLVRLFTFSYLHGGLNTWLAFGISIAATVAVITVYAALISRKLTGRARVRTLFKRVALPLVLVYCLYALVYLSSVNAKGPDVRAYYRSLHPALRIAVSTVILADRDIVVTDTHRIPSDYSAMGLPEFRQSLHYRQDDGYVHAMDPRTIGRPGWRNWGAHAYLRIKGFSTLRHVGTEDHLHVDLPVR
jgi:hypothetical protein